jgi:gas vesicle protein
MSAKNSFVAFLSGAALGAVVALLFAPEKGEVTRRKIRRAVEDGRDAVEDMFEEGRDAVVNAYKKGRERVANVVEEGRELLADAMEEGREFVDHEVHAVRGAVKRATTKRC